MSDSLSNVFQKGTPRAGGLQGPTQTSRFERNLPSSEQTATLLSGGKTSNLFLAGFDRINQGIAGLEIAESRFNQAQLIEFDATQEILKGKEQAGFALDALNDAQAANIVAAFASGITASGSVSQAQADVARQTSFSVQIGKAQARIRSGALKRKARQVDDLARRTRSRAKSNIIIGSITAAASLFL
jgi:hypothetical protein